MTRSSESFSLAMSVYQKHWNSFYLLLVTLIMDMWTRFQWTLSIAWGYWVSLTADTLPSEGSCGKLLLAENLVVIAHNYTQWIITMTKGFFQNVVYGLSSYIKIPIAAKMGRIVANPWTEYLNVTQLNQITVVGSSLSVLVGRAVCNHKESTGITHLTSVCCVKREHWFGITRTENGDEPICMYMHYIRMLSR